MIKLMSLSIPFFSVFFPYYASAYTWQFTSQPRQCQNLSIDVQGSGQPPYSLLLIPNGPSPLPKNTEVRTIQNIPFPGSSSSLSFNLNYPEGSSFVAVVSDSNGFGTGGTSTPVTVLDSSDSSCYDPTKGIQLPWLFYIEPSNLIQCDSVRWWWGQDLVNGTVNFYGVIPGGNSFNMPQGPLSTNNVTGTGFSWTVDISSGTNILIIGGDDRGIGSGVLPLPRPLVTLQEAAIPQAPAAGQTAVVGAIRGIAGGLVVIIAIALIAFFYPRRRGYSAVGRPVNVLHDDDDGHRPHRDVPHYYTPEPYLVPDTTIGRTFEAASTPDRPITMTTADIPRPAPMTTTRKNAPPPQQRTALAKYQRDVGEPETIELPPAYANIRPAQRPPSTVPTRTTASSTPALTKTTTSLIPA
ncbi:hypothetical protein EDB83DRAFT_2312513 [Lactarius deliciosus]|nr:hypothetical protein EDB83DRAFT_2312513 [Lactarius deliciosus]